MRRIRTQVTLDKDSESPDSIQAANEYLTSSIFETANALGRGLDWGTWRSYARKNANGELVITQWVRVLR